MGERGVGAYVGLNYRHRARKFVIFLNDDSCGCRYLRLKYEKQKKKSKSEIFVVRTGAGVVSCKLSVGLDAMLKRDRRICRT